MIRRRKLLLAVSAERVTLALWNGRSIARHITVANSDDGLEACRHALSAERELPVHVLVDAVEEDYRSEVLPHARGRDRRELVARKLRQHYRNTIYCAAEWQGREAEGRRDDRYQFAALTYPELLAPWCALVDELGLPLAGVHLLPMAASGLVARLTLAAPHVLLLAATSGGLRLTYFRDGRFRLSRLTRHDPAGGVGRAQFHVDEIANTRLYLHALQSAALDEPLAIVLLDPEGAEGEVFEAIAAENGSLECLRLASADIARAVKGCTLARGEPVELLFLHLLALTAPGYNLASRAALSRHRQLERRGALYRVCAGVVLASGAACAYAAWEAHRIGAAAEAASAERARYEAQYEAVKRAFPAAPAPAAALQQAVNAAQRLKAHARTPEPAMQAVARALAAAPEVTLNELTWKDGRAVSLPGAAATAGAAPGETTSVVGEIRPFSGDYRSAVAAIRAFADALARDPAVREVRIVRLPLNVDPAAAIAGSTRDAPEPEGTAEFTVQLAMKGEP